MSRERFSTRPRLPAPAVIALAVGLLALGILIIGVPGKAGAGAPVSAPGALVPAVVAPAPGGGDAVPTTPATAVAAPGELLVRLRPGTSQASVNALAASLGASRYRDLAAGALVRAGERVLLFKAPKGSPGALAGIASQSAGVIATSPNYRRAITALYPDDPLFPYLWALENTAQSGGVAGADISAPEAWSFSTGSSGAVVASIDTGVDYDHEDLAANMWVNPGEIPANGLDDDANGWVDDVYGIDAVNNDGDPYDDNGHGTHTSGTMAAVGANAKGIAGVSWHARIMALKFLSGAGWGYDSDAIECIDYAVDQKVNHGVNVVAINASWGGGGYDEVLEDAIDAAGAAGIVFCAAAGNGYGSDNDTLPFYPASYESATLLSVASTDWSDGLSAFSNVGARSVDLAAPGSYVLSALPRTDDVTMLSDGPFYDDVEAGVGAWTVESPWAITTEQALSPTHSWADSFGGQYLNDAHPALTSPVIDLSARPGPQAFAFSVRHDLEFGWDFLIVKFSGDGGVTWMDAGSVTGSTSGAWVKWYARIPDSVRTAAFRVRLRLETDNTVTDDGVYVDDLGFAALGQSDYYGYYSGTSMATPHVAGAVALAAARFPADTVDRRIERIREAVDELPALSGICATGGRLNVDKLLATAPPAIAVTAPAAVALWPSGSTQTVSWTTGQAPDVGEFRVSLVSSAGTWYVNKQVLPVAGQTAYSTSVIAAVPAGSYKAAVYWRPTVGSGTWAATAKSASFTVTPINVTVPAASTVWPTQATTTVSWNVNPAMAGGQFQVSLVNQTGGAWYVNKLVAATAGKLSYSTAVNTLVPPGTYKAAVYWRATVGSGLWTATQKSAAFTIATLTVSDPTASSSWPRLSTQSVAWSVTPGITGGEFRVSLVNAVTNVWYVNKLVPVVPGQLPYSTSLVASVPAGSYRAAVYWKPAGSVTWVLTKKTAAFTVTP